MSSFNFKTKCNQRGSAPVLFLFLLLVNFLYLKHGMQVLSDATDPLIAKAVLLILAAAALFCLSGVLLKILRGQKSYKRIVREMEKELSLYRQLISESQTEIHTIESKLPTNRVHISKEGLETLGLIRKIVAALSVRFETVVGLLERNSEIHLIEACELMEQNIFAGSNCFMTVIGGAEEEAVLDPRDVESALVELFDRVNDEVTEHVSVAQKAA